jgi:hypothetical protein
MGLGALELKRHRCDRHCKRGKGSVISKAVHRAFGSLVYRLRQQCRCTTTKYGHIVDRNAECFINQDDKAIEKIESARDNTPFNVFSFGETVL